MLTSNPVTSNCSIHLVVGSISVVPTDIECMKIIRREIQQRPKRPTTINAQYNESAWLVTSFVSMPISLVRCDTGPSLESELLIH
jgi:hypothetical protein